MNIYSLLDSNNLLYQLSDSNYLSLQPSIILEYYFQQGNDDHITYNLTDGEKEYTGICHYLMNVRKNVMTP